jgi:DNA-binding transcriptional regulator YdaS (Cro superfamily)
MARARRSPGRPRSPVSNKFARWLDSKGHSREWAAERLGVLVGHVNRLARGVRRPSLQLAAEIEKLTGGSVTVSDWTRP